MDPKKKKKDWPTPSLLYVMAIKHFFIAQPVTNTKQQPLLTINMFISALTSKYTICAYPISSSYTYFLYIDP